MSMLIRKRQLAAKIEAVEGTAETLLAADAGILVNFSPKASYDPQMYQRDPVRASLTKMGKLAGKRSAGIDFSIELKGSGSVTVEPEWLRLIRACGFASNALKKITIGAITTGPYLHGETITGETSGATGRVVLKTVNGTTTLYFIALSGTLETGEVITGGTSGATATASADPTSAGFEIKPVSSSVVSLTMGLFEDGIRKVLKGCRGTVKFNFKIGEPATLDFSFKGVEAGVADVPMFTGVSFDNTVPPVLLNAVMACDGVSLNIGEMEINVSNTLASKDKIDDAKGILSFMITGRDMQGSFNPEMVPVATHDFFSKWFSNTPMVVDLAYGETEGNKFRFYAPGIIYNKIDDGDRDGLQLAQTSFDLTGSMEPGDDELAILLL
ncbi:MAG TPA: hypothetical protein PKL77_10775 [Candidatus Omnitrophota bacterium]|nr:hypothetical protein [Candidatus Omnitrophota bacterium]